MLLKPNTVAEKWRLTLTACCRAGFRDPLAGTKAEQRTEDEDIIFCWASVPSAGTEDDKRTER